MAAVRRSRPSGILARFVDSACAGLAPVHVVVRTAL